MHLLTSTEEKLVVELRGSETLFSKQQTGISITTDEIMLFDLQTEQRIK